MKKSYKAYLWSPEWAKKSKQFKWDRNYTCELCGNHLLLEVTEIIRRTNHPSWKIPEVARFVELVMECKGNKDKLIQVHHRSYKNLGNETAEDLACVCGPCHVLITENTRDHDLGKAWEITQERVGELLSQIHNTPDGDKEFAIFIPYGEIKTDYDEEVEELKKDYYDFINDLYDTEEEFN